MGSYFEPEQNPAWTTEHHFKYWLSNFSMELTVRGNLRVEDCEENRLYWFLMPAAWLSKIEADFCTSVPFSAPSVDFLCFKKSIDFPPLTIISDSAFAVGGENSKDTAYSLGEEIYCLLNPTYFETAVLETTTITSKPQKNVYFNVAAHYPCNLQV